MWTPHHTALKEHPGNHMVWLDIRYEPALSTVRV